LLRVLQLI
jgi:hypothetical protein